MVVEQPCIFSAEYIDLPTSEVPVHRMDLNQSQYLDVFQPYPVYPNSNMIPQWMYGWPRYQDPIQETVETLK